MNQPEVQLSNKGFSTCMNLSGVFTSGQRGIYLQLDKSSAISTVNDRCLRNYFREFLFFVECVLCEHVGNDNDNTLSDSIR